MSVKTGSESGDNRIPDRRGVFSSSGLMVIKGSVGSIIFNNPENGYTVLRRICEGEEVTCTGFFPSLSDGEKLELKGAFENHGRFGRQFRAEECRVLPPESEEGILTYLSSGVLPYVGAVTAGKILKRFGSDALNVIEKAPERLAEISGISPERAKRIGEAYLSVKDMRDQIMFLQGLGITLNLAMKIYSVYKENSVKTVKENPYRLIQDVDGIGFLTADKIALGSGVGAGSEFRLCAGAEYALRESGEKSGNTYMTEDELAESASKVLKLSEEEFRSRLPEIMERLEFDLSVKRLDREGKTVYALFRNYNAERSIAARLVRLKNEAALRGRNVDDSLIDHYERINRIRLHPGQREAVRNAVSQGAAVITGGPGTGKTTVIKCLCTVFEAMGCKVECMSPTGRAAKRIEQATGRHAKTIHRALEYTYRNGMFFMRNENNPLTADVVIVDEASMVDIFVFNALLKAVKRGGGIVLVGDKDQLPSVGAGNVLSDIIKSNVLAVSFLSHIYRQSADSIIVSNAHLINECKMPVINNRSRDFFFIETESQEETAGLIVGLVTKRLPGFTGVQPADIQVLCPMKAGDAGVEHLNVLLQRAVNPPRREVAEFSFGKNVFRVGDKVMQTVNDYQCRWERFSPEGETESGAGVFNGDMGFITDIREEGVTILFDDGRVAVYSQAELPNITEAYAVTVHKSQGSEFEVVVIPVVSGPPGIINKNLLYTAVTRAKKTVVLIGSRSHLYYMVKNNYIVTRSTLLRHFLPEAEEAYKKYISDGGAV